MIERVKVGFILDHNLMGYRLPFFEQLSERNIDITVFHAGKKIENVPYLNQIVVKKTKILFFEYRDLPSLREFDVVVHMQNMRIINLWLLTFNSLRSFKLVHWGIGVSSAKGLSLRKSMSTYLRNFIAKLASAQVLYSDFPLPLFSAQVRRKTFIANNTIYNPKPVDQSKHEKTTIVFIGSLNDRKRLDILLRAYSVYRKCVNVVKLTKLVIIGDGPSKEKLMDISASLGINQFVLFAGNVSESKEKENYFKDAVVSISPLQAGLSVLESFSYGVPFISYTNAVSGGEHLNIKNDFNGYLVDSEAELVNHMINLNDDPKLGAKLGSNAFEYYKEHRSMKKMVGGFESAFQYVLK